MAETVRLLSAHERCRLVAPSRPLQLESLRHSPPNLLLWIYRPACQAQQGTPNPLRESLHFAFACLECTLILIFWSEPASMAELVPRQRTRGAATDNECSAGCFSLAEKEKN